MNSRWERCKETYPSHYPLNSEEERLIYAQFEEHFCSEIKGERYVFALWINETIYTPGPGHRWRNIDSQERINPEQFTYTLPNYGRIDNLDAQKGTGTFEGKAIKWNNDRYDWVYLNNRTVHFNNSTATATPVEEDDDTARVEELLHRSQTTVTSAIQKLQQPGPSGSSRPGTPSQPRSLSRQTRHSRQASPVPPTTRSTAQPASALPTPPVSKGKQRAPAFQSTPSTSAATLSHPVEPAPIRVQVPVQVTVPSQAPPPAPAPTPAPVPPPAPAPVPAPAPAPGPAPRPIQAPPPPPGGNPPNPPPMANVQQANTPRPVGSPPEPYDGSAGKAQAFWNALDSYYTTNDDVWTDESKRVAAALSHFKIGTPAGEWASDRMAAAAAAQPRTYGTWDAFKEAFKRHFIPAEARMESTQKMYSIYMKNREFNDWFQEWNTHATRASVDEHSKMYAFRKALNPQLHNKIVALLPQPDTFNALVDKARELDRHWRMFAPVHNNPARRPQNPRIRELASENPTAEISATQGRRFTSNKKKLTPEERKRRFEKNLCLYCGGEGHQAATCKAKPNTRPNPPFRQNTSMRQINTDQIEDLPKQDQPDISVMSTNFFAPLATIQEDEMMNPSSSF